MNLRVLRAGLLTSVQDLGRYGYQQFGVVVGGVLDPFALRVANLLVGNCEAEAALELTVPGPSLRFEAETMLAICGGDLSPRIDGRAVPGWRPVAVRSGSVLQFGEAICGCRAYLAVAGGLDTPEVLGSRSTYLRAGIGGFQGRVLRAADVLHLRPAAEWSSQRLRRWLATAAEDPFVAPPWCVAFAVRPAYGSQPVIRAMQGRQFEWFTADSRERFFSADFPVTPQSDRMGYRLAGPRLHLIDPRELISEAVAAGTVQVPAEGHPIILLADRPTIGGYAKIAQVATVDLPLVAQVKPGGIIRFRESSVEEAQDLYRTREADIQKLRCGLAVQEDT
jgi:antagonist of KipI